MQSVRIGTNQAGQRLDKFLHKYLPLAGNGFLYKMLRKKNITLNGKRAEGKEILQLADQVTLWLADETILKFGGYLPEQGQTNGQVQIDEPHPSTVNSALNLSKNTSGQSCLKLISQGHSGKEEALYCQAYKRLQGITVLYEDAHVLLLDKPAGVLTQQAEGEDLSLNEWMIGYLLDTGSISLQELRLFKPSVCNRLDRNTSGLVLCGKSLPGSQALSELIRNRTVRKFYRTICVGLLETARSGAATEIQGYLQKDSHTNRVTIRRQQLLCQKELHRQKKAGEYIRTTYRSMGQYCIPAKSLEGKKAGPDTSPESGVCAFTELEVELITGKPHQIRAHLASIGHPLVGDNKYGNASVNQLFCQRFGLRWQLLHAYRLQFPVLEGVLAPLSGRYIQAPLPAYFEAILQELEVIKGNG